MHQKKPDNPTVYVSITGLELHGPLSLAKFWWHAAASMMQAKRARGNISASARAIGGVQHTLTVWESKRAMLRFLYQGAHRKAIKAAPKIGTGKTYGYESSRVPSWTEAHEIWKKNARNYQESTRREEL